VSCLKIVIDVVTAEPPARYVEQRSAPSGVSQVVQSRGYDKLSAMSAHGVDTYTFKLFRNNREGLVG
jgi:hypothetical protein